MLVKTIHVLVYILNTIRRVQVRMLMGRMSYKHEVVKWSLGKFLGGSRKLVCMCLWLDIIQNLEV